jgi:hypothetical protein
MEGQKPVLRVQVMAGQRTSGFRATPRRSAVAGPPRGVDRAPSRFRRVNSPWCRRAEMPSRRILGCLRPPVGPGGQARDRHRERPRDNDADYRGEVRVLLINHGKERSLSKGGSYRATPHPTVARSGGPFEDLEDTSRAREASSHGSLSMRGGEEGSRHPVRL